MIPEADAVRKLQQVVARVDPRLVLDRANVRAVADPFPGVEYGLRLGEAAALLFLPEADLAAAEWETRVLARIEAARRYLEGFPPAAAAPRRPRPGRG